MTQALAEQQSGTLAPAFDEDLIRRMYAKDCTNDEFRIFCQLAKNYGLDPSMHQIWAVKYGNSPASFIVGRDGLLEFAHRSGYFDGMESGTTGDKSKGDLAGWAKVYRTDMSHPFCVAVDYQEYVATDRSGKPTRFWAEKPKTMITKVAEAQALRKAFRMSGIYCEDEMPSASEPKVIADTSAHVVHEAPTDNPNKCVSCGNDINPEHIEKILEHTDGVPMCDPCFSYWYRKQCAAKLETMSPAEETTLEPEPVTLVMCAQCGNAVEPAYVEFSKEKTGKTLCQKCFEAWAKAQQAKPEPKPVQKSAPKPKPAAPVTPKTICQGCGKVIAAGTTHCQACVEKEMGHKVPPAEKPVTDGPVCKACGAALTSSEIGFSKLFVGESGPLCKDCTGKLQRGEL